MFPALLLTLVTAFFLVLLRLLRGSLALRPFVLALRPCRLLRMLGRTLLRLLPMGRGRRTTLRRGCVRGSPLTVSACLLL